MFEEELKKNYKPILITMEEALNNLSNEIQNKQTKMFMLYDNIINDMHELIYLNYILKNYKRNELINDVAYLVYKNLITINSAILLIKNGYLGSAKIIFRNIYENLLIGKMFAITRNYNIYELWLNGKQISIRNEVFFKIKNEFSNDSLEFWNNLNKYNHGTIDSQKFQYEFSSKLIGDCDNYISVFLAMNYHLLNRYVCGFRAYYLDLYFNNHYKNFKHRLKQLIKFSNSMLDPKCKKVLKDYCKNWEI